MSNECTCRVGSVEETRAMAKDLGRWLSGGEVFALIGTLGAGKTHFVQGLAEGFDVPDDIYVRSPTFALIDTYPGRASLHHLDLYRLADIDELEAIGWRDLLDDVSVVAVEWADRIELSDYMPPDVIEVRIEIGAGEERTFVFRVEGAVPSWFSKLEAYAA
ncbi:MAG TPA: tRNA (adenosine(37)-N6)-threonylcarbamoyltransferase complex ATPase subunit type 1 TsaE [Myxococcales bacterium]|nr:tRNA (adenosine(37)-N6)-threonylcarbamoyltransferase complex ATPase subunit type 1 TsaE [Deltaproteobacteria bacterium]MBU47873.1 tRNA (adenosine(37)-N6)-threonylcarbamoyltransferase complex ATPase subunit type 1 TsaE [Deltaproteobacteria bacterium]HAA59267.1 tRNA (adenosine(37)-N6)-threonylcarbamoyltransferase complex ATPase subunit type 1 TsaE [Myxococcales bacterium]